MRTHLHDSRLNCVRVPLTRVPADVWMHTHGCRSIRLPRRVLHFSSLKQKALHLKLAVDPVKGMRCTEALRRRSDQRCGETGTGSACTACPRSRLRLGLLRSRLLKILLLQPFKFKVVVLNIKFLHRALYIELSRSPRPWFASRSKT